MERVKYLRTNPIWLRKRFNTLFCGFTRQNKEEYRDAVLFLLDKMLSRVGLPRTLKNRVNLGEKSFLGKLGENLANHLEKEIASWKIYCI